MGTINQNLKHIKSLPKNNFSKFIKQQYYICAALYEKEKETSPYLFRNFLEFFTKVKKTSFYNKIIADYEVNFKLLNYTDHLNIIKSFASVSLNHESLIKSAVNQIKNKVLSREQEIELLNNLVFLGYTNQEWKDLIITRLITNKKNSTDTMFSTHTNFTFSTRIDTLLSLYTIKYPENYNEIVYIILTL